MSTPLPNPPDPGRATLRASDEVDVYVTLDPRAIILDSAEDEGPRSRLLDRGAHGARKASRASQPDDAVNPSRTEQRGARP